MYNFLCEIKTNFYQRKFLVILGVASCLLGIVLALFVKYDFTILKGRVFILNPIKYVEAILSEDFSGIKLLFSRLAFGFLLLVIVFILGINSYTVFINYSLIIYKIYSVVFYFKYFISCFAFHGFIIFFFLILLDGIFTCAAILLAIINMYSCSIEGEGFNVRKRTMLITASFIILLLFGMCEQVFIYVIIRPFNLLVV